MASFPVLIRTESAAGEPRYVLGHPLVDRYLEFVAGRGSLANWLDSLDRLHSVQ